MPFEQDWVGRSLDISVGLAAAGLGVVAVTCGSAFTSRGVVVFGVVLVCCVEYESVVWFRKHTWRPPVKAFCISIRPINQRTENLYTQWLL